MDDAEDEGGGNDEGGAKAFDPPDVGTRRLEGDSGR